MKVNDILHLIKPLYICNAYNKAEFTKLSALDNADKESIIFIDRSKENKEEIARNTKASVIICDETVILPTSNEKCYIVTKNPRKVFLRIARYFDLKKFKCIEVGISSDSTIFENYVEVGANVIIRAGSIIGGSGFGYEWLDGEIVNWPHVGKVIINNNVEIGHNCCIDRGTLSNTIIGKNVKIGNLVHIAHNVIIGEDTIIAPQVSISGSTKIGKKCFIGAGAIIRDGIIIGNEVFIGMGSVVVKNIKSGITVCGNPAKKIKK